ncbi:MAG: methylated-DNA--[protein]-cysteine S-methyltransferase [Nitrospirae bacterium]|nr:methylated-DNA--[protein]-cysteine S-methyltransferase [Nitrospirota bacterium]
MWSRHQGCVMVDRILISRPDITAGQIVKQHYPDSLFSSCIEVDELAAQISAYLSGEKIRFLLDNLRLDQCSAFQQQVLKTNFDIPYGRVSTYQRIAECIGRPKAVRATGSALARNPFPIVIPCHRVVSSDLNLGGYLGGLDMKRTLLELEGIDFDAFSRVSQVFCFKNKR